MVNRELRKEREGLSGFFFARFVGFAIQDTDLTLL